MLQKNIIFNDKVHCLKRIIDYCNRTFHFNYLFRVWIIEEGTIELKVSGHMGIIVVSKLYSIPDFVQDL